jgi:C-terminal peptidase prc
MSSIRTFRPSLLFTCLLLLAFSVDQPSYSSEEKSVETYWQEIDLPFSEARKKINSSNCYRTENLFLGCISGIQAALQRLQPRWKLFLADSSALISHQIHQEFGSLLIWEPLSEELNTNQAQSFATLLEWRKFYQNSLVHQGPYLNVNHGPHRPIPFSDLMTWIEDQMTHLESTSFITASMINAVLRFEFDPHTKIMPAAYQKDQASISSRELVGLGVRFSAQENGAKIISLVEDGPAHLAGIHLNDMIYEANGVPLKGLSSSEMRSHFFGENQSLIRLEISRNGKDQNQLLSFDIRRAPVRFQNVTHRLIGKNGYIKIQSFLPANTCRETIRAVVSFVRLQTPGIILDLRGNGGGLLSAANCITNLFLSQGKLILSQKNPQTHEVQKTHYTPYPAIIPPSMKIAILMDHNSASASEIVAGALQDHQRAYLIGARSFGKGTVQMARPWGHQNGNEISLIQTTTRFHLPSGRTNQLAGVFPDFTAYSDPGQTKEPEGSLRAEDLYFQSIPTVPSQWAQPRQAEIDRIELCMSHLGEAEREFEQSKYEQFGADYALLVAQDVLSCAPTPR